MLQAEYLGKKLGDRWIIRNLSFEVKAGNALLVSGQNGSGKSTLLKLIAGLMMPTLGTFQFPTGERSEIIGYSALDQNLYPSLSALEHLELSRSVRQLSKDSNADLEALESSGLSASKDVLVGAFSTGMRARLKLLLAIQHQPKILLLDEPSAALDLAGQAWLRTQVEKHLLTGVCIIATNDSNDRRLANYEVNLG